MELEWPEFMDAAEPCAVELKGDPWAADPAPVADELEKLRAAPLDWLKTLRSDMSRCRPETGETLQVSDSGFDSKRRTR